MGRLKFLSNILEKILGSEVIGGEVSRAAVTENRGHLHNTRKTHQRSKGKEGGLTLKIKRRPRWVWKMSRSFWK